MKRSSISLVITEMQIKPTRHYHYTAIKWLNKRKEVRKEGRKEREKGSKESKWNRGERRKHKGRGCRRDISRFQSPNEERASVKVPRESWWVRKIVRAGAGSHRALLATWRSLVYSLCAMGNNWLVLHRRDILFYSALLRYNCQTMICLGFLYPFIFLDQAVKFLKIGIF